MAYSPAPTSPTSGPGAMQPFPPIHPHRGAQSPSPPPSTNAPTSTAANVNANTNANNANANPPISKRDKRRSALQERLQDLTASFSQNRDAQFRQQLHALQCDMTLINNAALDLLLPWADLELDARFSPLHLFEEGEGLRTRRERN
jgi:hypothetical protein